MKDIKQTIASSIIDLMIDKAFTPHEEAVLSFLTANWSDKEVTQKEIAESAKWKATHPLLGETTNINTTTRKIRRVIRNLRVEHRLPILHNEHGHYLPQTEEDIIDFMERLELEAKSRAASTIETYKIMKDSFGISSPTLDQFDAIGSQLVILAR